MGLLNILRDISYWDSKDWKIGGNFPQKTWPLCGRKGIQNPFDPSQSPSSCWHWNIQGTWCMCVCVPFNDFCVVFFSRFAMRKRPWFNIRTFFRCAPEIPSHCHFGSFWWSCSHQRSPEITRDHQSHQSHQSHQGIEVRQQIAECLGICLLPDGGLEENYWKGWGQWKPTKPLDYGCLKFSTFSCEPKWLLQILEWFA